MVTRYLEVRNIRQVAREWRISRTTVSKHLADQGIDASNRMSEAHITEAAQLYADGWSLNRLGAKFGVDPKTVKKRLAGF